MSAAPDSVLPPTGRKRTPWPGIVWGVPLAALIIVAYLGIHAWTHRGEVITVTFRRAAGASPGDTKVLYQGVEAGHLLKIIPNPDGRRLDFKLRLIPEAKPGLNTNARFWLIGASPTLSDLSSLKAVVSGVAVGYAPGTGGQPTTHFEGLEKAPTVLPGDRGTRYWLNAHDLGSIREGADVLFHGQPIGKVTEVQFKGESGFRVEVFIFQPYDSLVKPGARFWKTSPLRLAVAGGGITANLAPASALLSGGIDVEVPADTAVSPSPAEAEFILYSSRNAAKQGLSGPTVRYDFAFEGAAGDLDDRAAVTLLGFQIGEVETAHLAYDEHTGRPFTAVTASLYPQQLDLQVAAGGTAADSRAATDAKIRQLLRFGYRARLQQTPALVGSQSIALERVKGAPPADLVYAGPNPRIPSAGGSTDLDDIAAQADEILAKVNRVPIEEIGQNLKQVTASLRSTVGSPQLAESFSHLNSTLAQVDKMLGEVQPKVDPLMTQLNQAAGQISQTALAAHQLLEAQGGAGGDNLPEAIRQLTEAARSVRTLADYLDRHPEALIRGKRPEK